jgi:hypothetical protein
MGAESPEWARKDVCVKFSKKKSGKSWKKVRVGLESRKILSPGD